MSMPCACSRLARRKILGASQAPTRTPPIRNPAAFSSISPTAAVDMDPPPLAASTIPWATASITSPSTSSMTAAPRMMRASGESIRFRSWNTRAVIPTLVAQSTAPMNM